MTPIDRPHIVPNAHRLLWAGFMAILAAGVGFAIRGGILDNWGAEYGFTAARLGIIAGAGFTGFCFGIIVGGVVADRLGYGKLVIAAFVLHVLSAVVTFAAVEGMSPDAIFNCLLWGTFIFGVANGTLEAVANPLVATIFPNNRTHYLNILHASWPAGMILGGVAGWVLDDQLAWPWKQQLALFLIPTAIYGLMFLGQRMPKSEASEKGLSLGDMLRDVGLLGGLVVCLLLVLFFQDNVFSPLFSLRMAAEQAADAARIAGWVVGGLLLLAIGVITRFSLGSVLLFVLFVTHTLVGSVELGTDSWIQNITGNLFTSQQGKILFVYTSAIMFILRFCAEFIEKRLRLTPVGLLLVCSILACIGLNLTSQATTFGFAVMALTVYGVGKTFFWPTMLAVASDRFPRTGAVAISIMGGIGMMSAGLIGIPGLGFFKDRYAAESLNQTAPELFAESKSPQPSRFLFFPEVTGIDGKKLGEAGAALTELRKSDPAATPAALPSPHRELMEASIAGDRQTLVIDSVIPATMAVIYLILVLYFKSIGGYKSVHLGGSRADGVSDQDGSIPARPR